jgi:hypothetical protein
VVLLAVDGDVNLVNHVSQVVQLVVDGDVNLEPIFERLVTTTICYVTAVSRYSAAQSAGTAAFKFWKSIEQRSFDMLEKVSTLLCARFELLLYLWFMVTINANSLAYFLLLDLAA